jgi:hypothetical protein
MSLYDLKWFLRGMWCALALTAFSAHVTWLVVH